jgi:protein SCO1
MDSIKQPINNEKNKLQKLVLNKWFWLIFCIFFFAFPIYRSMNRILPPTLIVYSKLPDYKFSNENGAVFGSEELKGKAYIANFFFTSCPTTCPKIMRKMQKIQKRVKGVGQHIALVSFTVDPEYDTQKVLFNYARDNKANPYIWKFLRADLEATKKLLLDGFKIAIGEKEKIATNIYDIIHSAKFVLVDDQGRIRGYYDTDKAAINQLMIDVGLLINRDKLNFKKREDENGKRS